MSVSAFLFSVCHAGVALITAVVVNNLRRECFFWGNIAVQRATITCV